METNRASHSQTLTGLDGDFLQSWNDSPDCLSSFLLSHGIVDPRSIARYVNMDQQERARLQAEAFLPAERYLELFPTLQADDEAVFDVIFQEYVLGHEADPDLKDKMAERFPKFAQSLATQVGVYRLITNGRESDSDEVEPIPLASDADRFDLQEVVGRGGVGIVYRAFDRRLRRLVAVKMLHEIGAQVEFNRDRFDEEACIIAALQHPNIVQVYEQTTIQGQSAIIFELIDGGSLAALLESGSFSARDAARICRDVALGMEYAHQRGIVHRDLKPSNILLARSGGNDPKLALIPKVTDFGLAKRLDLSLETLAHRNATLSGQLMGTPRYLAPEQAMGKTSVIGPMADVHALGTIFYEMLVGRVPFEGPSVFDLMQQIAKEDIKFTIADSRRIPKDLQVICLKCLEKDPNRRYESARSLAEDFDRYLNGQPILARPISSFQTLARWIQRNPVVASLVSAVMILLAVLTVGSTLSAMWLGQTTNLAIKAKQEAMESEQMRRNELFRSLIDNARSLSESGQEGQRLGTIQRLREAMNIIPLDTVAPAVRADIFNIALAAATKADVRELASFPIGERTLLSAETSDQDLKSFVHADPVTNVPLVRSLANAKTSWSLAHVDDPFVLNRRHIGLSASGRWIADVGWTAAGHQLRIWDVEAQRVVWTNRTDQGGVSYSFHPDDRQLAYSSGGFIHVLDLDERRSIKSSPMQFRVRSLRYSPDGSLIAVCGVDGDLQILDVSTWTSTKVVCPTPIGALSWHPREPALVAATREGRLYAWNAHSKLGTFLNFPRTDVVFLTYSPDGAYLAVADQSSTWLLRANGVGSIIQLRGRLVGFNQSSSKVAIAVDERIRIGELIDLPGMRQIRVGAESSTFHADSSMLAISGKDGVLIVSMDGPGELANFELDHAGPVAFSPDGRSMLTFGTFSGPNNWPIRAAPRLTVGPPEKLPVLPNAGESPWGLRPQHKGKQTAYSADGQQLAVVNYRDDRIELRDLSHQSSRILASLSDVTHVAFSPNGSFVAGASVVNPRVVVWNAETSQVVLDLPGHGAAAFSSDGKRLVTRTNTSVELFDGDTWEHIRSIPIRAEIDHHDRPIAYQPNSQTVAVAGPGGRVYLVDSHGGTTKTLLPIPEGQNRISSLTFSPDGRRLSATRVDFDVTIWDLFLLEQQLADMGIQEELVPPLPPSPPKPVNSIMVDRGKLPPAREWHTYWRMLAIQETLEKRWMDALDSIENAIADCPSDESKSLAELQTLRGNLLWRCNRSEEAREAWKSAIDLSPESLAACRSLATLYVAGPVGLREPVRALALTAVLQSRDRYRADAQVLIGMAQVRTDQFREALGHFDSVIASAELQSTVPYFRAIALHQLGQHTEAQAALEASRVTTHSTGSLPIDWASLNEEAQRVQGNPKSLTPELP
ncbi:protein kinase [bacterium]|nr:protein kinase [bacterium]